MNQGQDGVVLVPGLADMPEVSDDGTEYTFTLKEATSRTATG